MVKYYTVKFGDTLSKIAKEFGTTPKAIQNANPKLIQNLNTIYVGSILTIPVSEGSEKTYEEIGRAFVKCSEDIEKLDSFNKLMDLLDMVKV